MCKLCEWHLGHYCYIVNDWSCSNCSAPPLSVVSVRAQRDKFRRTLMAAFDSYFHPDHSIPRSEACTGLLMILSNPVCSLASSRRLFPLDVSDLFARSPQRRELPRRPSRKSSVLQIGGIRLELFRLLMLFFEIRQDPILIELIMTDFCHLPQYKKPSLFKRLTMLGQVKPPSGLTPAERFIQSSIRKRASAFVDARDDLETKIGRLSRRLNFLMTESELWKQKFVSFEEYAEALSTEAAELRSKINKEQRESKRLSAQVTVTAQEKEALKQSEYQYCHLRFTQGLTLTLS